MTQSSLLKRGYNSILCGLCVVLYDNEMHFYAALIFHAWLFHHDGIHYVSDVCEGDPSALAVRRPLSIIATNIRPEGLKTFS
jgi:hypothetical protein